MSLSVQEWNRIMRYDTKVKKAFVSLPLVLDGHLISKPDKYRVYDAYISWCDIIMESAILADNQIGRCAEFNFRRTYSPANMKNFMIMLAKEDVGCVASLLKAMLLALRHLSIKKGNLAFTSYDAWLDSFEVERSNPIYQFLAYWMRSVYSSRSTVLFKYTNTILQYTSRLTLHDVDWIIEEEVNSYLDFEDLINTQSYDLHILKEMKKVINDWFYDFNIECAQPKHGYGATAGVRRSGGTDQKYADFSVFPGMNYLAYTLGWDPGLHMYPDITTPMYSEDVIPTDESSIPNDVQMMHYQLVPKGINKKRGVSKEPTSHMFFQKMLSYSFDMHFRRHTFMGINLHDQERSRSLCLDSSSTHEYGTLDLSSASDSVTYTLVRYLFQDQWFWPLMELTRTKYCTFDIEGYRDRSIKLEKYAPMGSALCFPVECVVFAAICEVASRRKGLYDKQRYVVYGDDIIAHKTIYDEVVLLLTKLNFLVNYDKSYVPESDFKEACGMEAYRGLDVSPLRISRKWDICKFRKAKCHQSTILNAAYDAANDAYIHQFYELRKALIQQTLDIFPGAIFSNSFEYGFFSTTCNLNEHLRRRLDRSTQKICVKAQIVTSKLSRGNDEIRYCRMLEEYDRTQRTTLIDPEDRYDVKSGASRSYTKWTWVPIEDIPVFNPTIIGGVV